VSPYDIVRQTLQGLGATDDAAWKRFLHDGFLTGSASAAVSASVNVSAAASILAAHKPVSGDIEVVLHRDGSVDDGRFANNGWLQEMPDSITKVTWDNVVMMSQKTAKSLGLPTRRSGKIPEDLSPAEAADAKDGQYDQPVVKITVGGRSVEGPVWIQPGLADGTVALALGYGRRVVGRVGRGVGFDAYGLFQSASRHITAGKVEKVFRKHRLAVTQEHGLMEGRPVIREAHLEQFKASPKFAQNMDLEAHLPHYVPYKEELAEIRIAASMFDGDQNPIAFINWSADDSLPYLLPEKKHKNLNIHSFPIDENDIELLTSVVERANEVVDKMLQE
jgi:molybdopterin-containing oxidoreductase family iron-sulfur binding subunit